MALVDTLDYLPANHPARRELIAQVNDVARGSVNYQDADTGVWWQVMDKGDTMGNYREATGSTMFVYALAKAINKGYLPKSYEPAVLKGYRGVLKEFVRTNDSGALSLIQCCQVAVLGFKSARGGPRGGAGGGGGGGAGGGRDGK